MGEKGFKGRSHSVESRKKIGEGNKKAWDNSRNTTARLTTDNHPGYDVIEEGWPVTHTIYLPHLPFDEVSRICAVFALAYVPEILTTICEGFQVDRCRD